MTTQTVTVERDQQELVQSIVECGDLKELVTQVAAALLVSGACVNVETAFEIGKEAQNEYGVERCVTSESLTQIVTEMIEG